MRVNVFGTSRLLNEAAWRMQVVHFWQQSGSLRRTHLFPVKEEEELRQSTTTDMRKWKESEWSAIIRTERDGPFESQVLQRLRPKYHPTRSINAFLRNALKSSH